jgi:large subunit ribosomal protein L1
MGKQKESKKKQDKVKTSGLGGGERVVAVEGGTEKKPTEIKEIKETEEKKPKKEKQKKEPGKKYKQAKKKVDPEKKYLVKEAVKLVKDISITKFTGNLEAHLVINKTGRLGEVDLPYFKGKEKKIAIASDEIIKKIKKGNIDFDVLLASPKWMPKLAKFGKTLGPQGLMPNPKDGTLTDNPQKLKKKMEEKETIKLETERKQPVMHLVLGKLDQPQKELVANIEKLISYIGPKKIQKLVLTPTMGPGVKVKVSTKG